MKRKVLEICLSGFGDRMLLKLCTELDLGVEAASRGVDLFKVLSVYNLHYWFNGHTATVVLDLYEPAVALVGVDGRSRVYASSCRDEDLYVRRLRRLLGLDEGLEDFFSKALRDLLLSMFASEWRGWRLRGADLWWALVVGICQQNASFRQGWSMILRIVDLYGWKAELSGGGVVVLPPPPEHVLQNPSRLVEAGVGYRAKTIEGVAQAFAGRAMPSVEELERLDSSRIEDMLTGFRGVGSYTARIAMVLALRRYDLLPVDRWLRTIASKVYGVPERDSEKALVRVWGKWSGLAAIALTITLDAAPLREALARIERGELLPKMASGPSPATLWRFTELTKRRPSATL